jgi:molecular chaperone DnaK (HSP70)
VTANVLEGDYFLVCDAGGGTVDVATFELGSLDPLRLKRVGNISGEKCGASYIDRHFLTWLQSRVPGLSAMSAELAGGHYVVTEDGQTLLERFEVLKRTFDGNKEGNMTLPSRDGQDYGADVGTGSFRLTKEDLMEIFSFSVNGTLDLIERTIINTHNLLIGGRNPRIKVKSVFYKP